jgi:hypothetical protein
MSILVGATSACAGAAGASGSSADLGETIQQSLRFRNDSGVSAQYLHNTSLAGHQLSNYTISVWVKRGNFTDGSARYIITSGDTTTSTGGGNNVNKLSFNHDGSTPGFVFKDAGGDTHSSTQPRHTDYSAWYHVVAQRDHSAGTVKLYINGTEIGSASATGSPGLFNQSGDNAVLIGLYADPDYGSSGWNGYMAEFNFLESKLEPTDFARTNDDGVWVPKDLSGLTSDQYGAKGFRLKFDSSAGLGDDSAPTGGNHASANDFTAVGFDTAAISTSNFDNDIDYEDTPTKNYPTFNRAVSAAANTYSSGQKSANLGTTGLANNTGTSGCTMALPSTGKIYFEYTTVVLAHAQGFGINDGTNSGYYSATSAGYDWWVYLANGQPVQTGSQQTTNHSSSSTASAGQIYGFTYDCSTREGKVYLNNTLIRTETLPAPPSTVKNLFLHAFLYSYNSNELAANYGQRPFVYTPPTGFEALQSNLLPEPTIKNGREHFDCLTWSGDGTNGRDISGLNFQPDLVWIKRRNGANQHNLYDSVRGVTKHLTPDNNYNQSTTANSLTAFNSDGIQVGTGASDNTSSPASTYVGWCWKAGGTAVTNDDGSTQSTISANSDAGFSIVTWTGTGSNTTVGHGLSSAPELVFIKNYGTNTTDWVVQSTEIAANEYLHLNASNSVPGSPNASYSNGAHTASVLNIGSFSHVNESSGSLIAYCWHSVEGYQKIGRFKGNNNSDGPFVYTGFSIQWVMIKAIDSSQPWLIWDVERTPSNPTGKPIRANSNVIEDDFSTVKIDILSNGFKIRGGHPYHNNSGEEYLYMAIASNPFGGENAPPATAR